MPARIAGRIRRRKVHSKSRSAQLAQDDVAEIKRSPAGRTATENAEIRGVTVSTGPTGSAHAVEITPPTDVAAWLVRRCMAYVTVPTRWVSSGDARQLLRASPSSMRSSSQRHRLQWVYRLAAFDDCLGQRKFVPVFSFAVVGMGLGLAKPSVPKGQGASRSLKNYSDDRLANSWRGDGRRA